MKKYSSLFFPVLVILSAAVGFLLVKNTQQPNSHEVKITTEGFSPKIITIETGDSITWINSGNKPHWPASDFHPTHGEYPSTEKGCIGSALDSCRGLKQKEEYSFIFDKKGTWHLHDHLFPHMTMTITVTGKNAFNTYATQVSARITKIFQSTRPVTAHSFRQLPEDRKREVIEDLAKKDPKNAWAFLSQAAAVNGETIANAHEFAHIIGRSLYNKNGIEGIATCGSTFSYGCYHGAVSEALVKEGLPAINNLETSCLKGFKTGGKGNPRECLHGLGHGIITLHNLELLPSLKDCDRLQSKDYRRDCYMGVFMEHSYSAPSIKLDNNNPWRFCTDLPSQSHSACAAYFPKILMDQYGRDLPKIGSICTSSSNPELWKTCMFYIGSGIAVESIGDENKILSQCSGMKDENGQVYCVMGAAQQITYEKYPDWQEKGKSLCTELPAAFQEECMQSLRLFSN